MNKYAIIGGTGLSHMDNVRMIKQEIIKTPYGEPSAPLIHCECDGQQMIFLPRHGQSHRLPPHKINYRANIWALKNADVTHIIAVAAVGGIPSHLLPESLVVPNQIIDYTHSRIDTFFEESLEEVTHIDFTHPYCEALRKKIIATCHNLNLSVETEGTYAATQGPRLETAAEIDRLERDGCHIVGMTGMPEAALAQELGLCYATIAVVANLAAGRGKEALSMKMIHQHLEQGVKKTQNIITNLLSGV